MFKLVSEMQLKPFDPQNDDAEQFSDGAIMFDSSGRLYTALATGNNPAYEVLHDLTSFIDSNALSTALTGYATEAFVTSQGYQDSSDVSSAISTALVGNATQAWASYEFYSKSQVDNIQGLANYHDKTKTWTRTETTAQIESAVQDSRELVIYENYENVQNPVFPTNYFATNTPYWESMEILATDQNITFDNAGVVASITGSKHNQFRCKIINTAGEGTITVSLQDTGTSDPKFVIPQDRSSGATSFTIPAGKVAEIFYTTNSSAGEKFCVIYS